MCVFLKIPCQPGGGGGGGAKSLFILMNGGFALTRVATGCLCGWLATAAAATALALNHSDIMNASASALLFQSQKWTHARTPDSRRY